MELYKYCNFDLRSQNVLLTRNVWYSRRDSLNDPYDCLPIIECDMELEDINDYTERRGFLFGQKTHIDLIKKQMIFQFEREFLDKVGIYCLSSDPENELMWAHYANNNCGIMIGWEIGSGIPKVAKENHMGARRVIYTGRGRIKMSDVHMCDATLNQGGVSIPKKDGDVGEILLANIIESCYLRKNDAWKYEDEIRFINQRGHGLTPFNASISSVTYGCRFDESLKSQVKMALGADVREFRMQLGPTGLLRVPA